MAKQRRSLTETTAPRDAAKIEYANTPEEVVAAVEARKAEEAARAEPSQNVRKATLTLPADLLAELRAMSVELPPKAFPSISGFAAAAIREAVERARIDHNDGKPFEREERPKVRTGRPPGS